MSSILRQAAAARDVTSAEMLARWHGGRRGPGLGWPDGRAGQGGTGARAHDRLARLRRERGRAPERLRRLREARPAGRHGHRASDEGEALARRGGRDRDRPPGRAAPGGAVRSLPGVRRLPLPGSRVRGAARGEGRPGRGRARADRTPVRIRAGAGRPGRVALPLPQQARVLVHPDAGRPGARVPPGGPLGRGARPRALLADDRPRQRDSRRRANVGAGRGAAGVRPGGADRLPPTPGRARGAQHRPGARHARDGARGIGRGRAAGRRAAALPGGALDPLGRERPARRGDEPPDAAPLGRAVDRGGASSGCGSACGRTPSSRRTRRCARCSTGWRATTRS